jgi:hypothetical protein
MNYLHKLLGSTGEESTFKDGDTAVGKHGTLGKLVRTVRVISGRSAAGRERAGKALELLVSIYSRLPKNGYKIGDDQASKKLQLKISTPGSKNEQSKSAAACWQVLNDNIDAVDDRSEGAKDVHLIIDALERKDNAALVIQAMILEGAASIISHSNTVGTTSQRLQLLTNFYKTKSKKPGDEGRTLMPSQGLNEVQSLTILEQWLTNLDQQVASGRRGSVVPAFLRRSSASGLKEATTTALQPEQAVDVTKNNKGLLMSLFLDIAFDLYTELEGDDADTPEKREESRRLKLERHILAPVLLGTEHKSARKSDAEAAYAAFTENPASKTARLTDTVVQRGLRKRASEEAIQNQCRLISAATETLKHSHKSVRTDTRAPLQQLQEESVRLADNLKIAVPTATRQNLSDLTRQGIHALRLGLSAIVDPSEETCRFDALTEKGRLSFTLQTVISQLLITIPNPQFPSAASVYKFIGHAVTEGEIEDNTATVLGHEIASRLGVAINADADEVDQRPSLAEVTYLDLVVLYPPLEDARNQTRLVEIAGRAPDLNKEDLEFLSKSATDLGVVLLEKAIAHDHNGQLLNLLTQMEVEKQVKSPAALTMAKGTLGRGNNLFSKVLVAVSAPQLSPICKERISIFCESPKLDQEYPAATKDGYYLMTEPALAGKPDLAPLDAGDVDQQVTLAANGIYSQLPELVDSTGAQLSRETLDILGHVFEGAYAALIAKCPGKEQECLTTARQLMLDILFLRQLNTELTVTAEALPKIKGADETADDAKPSAKESNIKLAAKLLQNVVNRSKVSKETHVTKLQASDAGQTYRSQLEDAVERIALKVPSYKKATAKVNPATNQ